MIEVINLKKEYHDDAGDSIALADVSFKLPNKGMIFIVGKSGCGKTTLLNILGGLDNLTSGKVLVNKKDLSKFTVKEIDNYRNSTVGFVFQDFCLIERLTVLDNIKMAIDLQNVKHNVDYDALLKRIGLSGLEKRYPHQLSAGQKQRVAIARAVVKNPEIILADEPTGNVDEKTSYQILSLLKTISKEKLVVIISHNPDEAYRYADRIIEMEDGTIINDKSLNTKFYEELYIDDKLAILPGNGKVSYKDIEKINEAISKSNGNYEIIQSEEKFISKEPEIIDEDIELKSVKMNNKVKLKYSHFFFRKKLFFNIFMVLLITFVTSCFAILQSLSFQNLETKFQRILTEENILSASYYSYKDNYTAFDPIDSVYVDELKYKYNIEFDKVYDINLCYTNSSIFNNGSILYPTLLTGLYYKESNGLVITSKEELAYKLNDGKLEILYGNISTTSSGIIITDYIADSIINSSEKYSSYKDIVDAGIIYNNLDVDAVIKTNLYEVYEDEIANFNDIGKKSYTFRDDLINKYSFIYSINENFFTDYKQMLTDNNIEYSKATYFSISDDNNNFYRFNAIKGFFTDELASDEIMISTVNYNTVFKTKYNAKNLDEFVPHDVNIKLYDSEMNTYIDKTFTIVGLFIQTQSKDGYRLSSDYFDICYENEHNIRMLNFGKESLSYELVLQLKDEKFSTYLSRLVLVTSTIELLEAFKSVFLFIGAILIFSIFMIILLNASTIIKHNVYEIGLMKAFGAKTNELVTIFSVQMILTCFLVMLLLYSSTVGLMIFANELLCLGISAYINVTFKMNIIYFNYSYFFINIITISLFTILCIVVPIISIRKIKPLRIIKNRN